ncbi:SdpI family protein [Gordonia amicalis]|uniref:SdpI family protein n=1 Tax=Gordonia amicalis TaxID=89053 RepID=UPI0002A62776|nr:SdpI family protein [Gordonia amicalis]MBA5846939.1 SdpI family protein [Gordonia amicalis]MDV7099969.1 SdpI family protein [Gordonia amicalis]MDV7173142.1 SdpI family protein [Gordonia amicalis]NKX79606.1 SdpI family protein [Gordonia amicalis]UOG20160.1 SdpI family protein [Gordonia amicalis]
MLWVVNALSVVVAVLLFALAGLWTTVGVRGLRGTLPRNRRLGVRTDETMRSDEAFRVANRVAAPGTLGASVILVLGAVATLAVDGGWSVLFGVVALVAALVIIGLVSAIGVRAAATVPAEDAGCSCCSGHDDAHSAEKPAGAESDAAADCGTSSCGACSLRGVCANDTAQA